MKSSLIVIAIGIVLCCIGVFMGFFNLRQQNIAVITFVNGTIHHKEKVKKGSLLVQPSNPIKNGYKFLGWFCDGVLFDFSKLINNDITLEAKWEKIEGLPVVDDDKIDNIENDEGIIEENVDNNISNNEVENNTDNNSTNNYVDKPVENKKFNVSFNSNGGSYVSSQVVQEGNKVLVPSIPVRDGYTFVGWYLNGATYNFSSIVKNNIELVANWKKNDVLVTSISLDRSSYSMDINTSIKLNATITPNDATNKTIIWTSSNTSVATVVNGTVQSFGVGSATITATVDGKSATCLIMVTRKITYTYEIVDVPGSTLGQCYIYVKNSDGNYVNGKVKITYSNGKSEVVDIPSSGLMFPNKLSISSISDVVGS